MTEAKPCPTCGYQIDRVERLNTEIARLQTANRQSMEVADARSIENAKLRMALEWTLPIIAAAAGGASVTIAAGDVYQRTRASLGLPEAVRTDEQSARIGETK